MLSLVALLAQSSLAFVAQPPSARCDAASRLWHQARTAVPRLADTPPSSVSKQALVDSIAIKAGVSKKTAGLVLGATLDVIVDSVSEGHKVSLIGFGTFTAKQRPQREARNPKTGEKMIVPAATVPSFSFGKSFKDAVKAANAEPAPPAPPAPPAAPPSNVQ